MKKSESYSAFKRKGIFFVCLFSLLLFASNAFADLYSFNLIYANAELNGGAMDNYATVTVNLTAEDQATINFESLNDYRLQNRLGVQVNAFVFGVSNWTDGDFVNQKNFSEFGDFNVSFDKIGKITSFSFNVTNNSTSHWTLADQVLRINDWGYLAVAHIVPQQGNSGYAAGDGSAVPLPGAVWLLGSGLVGLAAIRRRRAA
ncbi:VPLPA-CTERM protein sorting domain-containing protein [Syntrophus gentianae]|uniref:VPLPA-CTERM protein sorting domain-containing protein n=1 Tax=Syntrophus gentianae TaxID=43775 RepID=A0A1H7UX48_9BACT|nr:VPLPA-CTERM sorting domain-containing protein [Syntrophus gentianae]SEM01208.1 VPLPA-CTERM protein sorting domain-containing protein [Syntrophus gentianae]